MEKKEFSLKKKKHHHQQQVTYTEESAILTLEDAIAQKSEHPWASDDSMAQHLRHGNMANAQCVRFFEGSVTLAASDHL